MPHHTNELVASFGRSIKREPRAETIEPKYEDFRDIRHSLADISRQNLLGYHPQFFVRDGLKHAEWYLKDYK